MKNSLFNILFIVFLTIYSSTILSFNRSLFFTRFDISYWQERFDQSQWRLAFTERIIGDEGLYAYEGYTYANGVDPTLSNAEAPPLGKYLIGWSIRLFGNPYWAGIISTLLSIIVFHALLKKACISGFLCFIGAIIFACDPLIFQQTTAVMLDSTQLLFLLLSLYMLTAVNHRGKKGKSFISIFASGLFLGAFSAVKIPMLTPFFVVAGILYFRKLKLPVIFSTFLYASGIVTSYVASYIRYFQLNHSVIDWLRIQKWMISFYQESNLLPNTGSVVTTLLFNRTQNFFTKAWEAGDIWSITWPCITVLFIFFLVGMRKRKETILPMRFIYLSYTLIIAILYFLVPFSTRYLLILLPLLYIISLTMLSLVKNKILFSLLICLVSTGNLTASFSVLFPTPERSLKQFVYDWEHGYFNDMYERIDSSSRMVDRTTFHRIGQTFWSEGQIEKAKIRIGNTNLSDRFASSFKIPLSVTYQTQFLGEFSEKKTISAVKENDTWKFHWNYSDLLEGLSSDSHLTSTVEFAKRGSITINEELVTYDFPSILISIIPSKIDYEREQEMVTYIECLFDKKVESASIHDRYIVSRILSLPVAIGVLRTELSLEQHATLLSFPGISLRPAKGRITNKDVSGKMQNTAFDECCSYLYSTSSYDGISGIEQQYNNVLKGINGGTIQILGEDGSIIRTIISRNKIDGKDINISS